MVQKKSVGTVQGYHFTVKIVGMFGKEIERAYNENNRDVQKTLLHHGNHIGTKRDEKKTLEKRNY